MQKFKFLFFTSILTLFGYPLSAFSSEDVVMAFETTGGLVSGYQPDSALILKGRVSYRYPHLGFNVSGRGMGLYSGKSVFVLNGTRNRNNKLRARIEFIDVGPVLDTQGGIKFYTVANSVPFRVVMDGRQFVNPDTYSIILSAEAILSD